MNRLCRIITLVALLPAAAALAAGPDANVVRSVQVRPSAQGAEVSIAGSRVPTFTVFRLADPARIVVDIAGADVSAVRGAHEGAGPVLGVAASQFSDENASVGRLVVALADGAAYDVKPAGNEIRVAVRAGSSGGGETAAAPAPSAPPAAVAAAPAVNAPANDVVASRVDRREVASPGAALTRVGFARRDGAFSVQLKTDGEVGTFEVIELSNPPRLAIDLFGFKKAPRVARAETNAPVREVRFGKHDDKIRVVLEAAAGERMPTYDVTRTRDGLVVAFAPAAEAVAAKPAAAPAKAASPTPAVDAVAVLPAAAPETVAEMKKPASPAPASARPAAPAESAPAIAAAPTESPKAPPAASPVADKPAPRARLATVRDVTFRGDESKGRVVISVPRGTAYEVTHPDPRTAVLTLHNAELPKRLERSLDTSAFDGPVKMVSSFAAPGQTDTVNVVAALDGTARDRVFFDKGQLTWEFAGEAATRDSPGAEMILNGQRMQLDDEAVSSPRASASAMDSDSPTGRRGKYSGRRVSFEFKDIDIHNLLRIIAEVSKKNVIVADNVSGKVTVRLRNVPWDQALDLILKSKNLDKEEMGNIIRVAPLKELEEERRIAAEQAKLRAGVEPLKVRLIPVNYATAQELSGRIKDVLSERGTLSVDQRTNMIIVKDTLEALARAEGLVRRLDTQTPQVLIESRIVEANSSFAREFGIQWGGAVNMGPTTGNPTGLTFPSVARAAGGMPKGGASEGTADVPNYAVDLPAAVGAGQGGAIGFSFGSAGGAVGLNLRLSAMETNGQIKTISAPKITTLDNTAATIGQGISIPFSQVSAAGVNTTFVEAKLELKVTPHVTADGSVLMDVNATNNQPDPGITGANGQPSISKKEAKTQVLVKDGETTVIGGIYTRSQALNEAAVPVLSRIPVLGWLFKKKRETDSRTELLIFITPRIINRSQMVVTGEPTVP